MYAKKIKEKEDAADEQEKMGAAEKKMSGDGFESFGEEPFGVDEPFGDEPFGEEEENNNRWRKSLPSTCCLPKQEILLPTPTDEGEAPEIKAGFRGPLVLSTIVPHQNIRCYCNGIQ